MAGRCIYYLNKKCNNKFHCRNKQPHKECCVVGKLESDKLSSKPESRLWQRFIWDGV